MKMERMGRVKKVLLSHITCLECIFGFKKNYKLKYFHFIFDSDYYVSLYIFLGYLYIILLQEKNQCTNA